jgi:FlaA1/EpsC-like NDP-sugar epimerase
MNESGGTHDRGQTLSDQVNRNLPASILILLAVDTLVLFTSLYYGVAIRYTVVAPLEYSEVLPLYPRATAYTLIMLASLAAMGMYARSVPPATVKYYVRFVTAFAAGALLMYTAGYFAYSLRLNRGSIVLTAALACVLLAGTRFVLHRYVLNSAATARAG